MIHDLRPYPAMKDSGVPWLGPVPEHWDVKSLGSLTTSRSERNRPELPLLSVVREKGVILRDRESKEENHNFIPDDLSNYKVVREGDLVINKMKAWQGSMGLAPQDGIVSPAYYVFDFAVENRHYGQALLRSRPYVGFFAQASDGVRIGQWDLSITGMKRIPVTLPPPAEQAAIVRFLDHADRRIRKAIAAKQRLIKLLQEQKQVIIHQAVTRGLDPNVKLKPSGVEWLGDVPEGWEVVNNRALLRQKKVLVGKKSGQYTLLSLTLSGVIPRDLENAKGKFPTDFDTYQEVNPEQLVLCLFDVDETPRTVGLSKLSGMITGAYDVFDISAKALPEFVYYWYLDIDNVKGLRPFYSGLRKVVPRDAFMSLKVPLPSLQEQQAIVQHIEAETTKLDQAIDRAQAEISLLREYRTRLIADVVTGKLDVREAAARLPEPEQDALPDELDAGEDEGLEGEEEGTGEEE